jgi:sugar transferase (PEP-CTERM/EpsH1 system associated)
MRILMLAHRLPYPPHTGDKVRAYHVARHLSREHRLTLACLADQPDAATAVTRLREEIPDLEVVRVAAARQRLRALVGLAAGRSATMAYFDSAELANRVARRSERDGFDLIYVSSSSMFQYVRATDRTPVVMDFVDVDSEKWLEYGARLRPPARWIYALEGQRLRRLEGIAARRANRCLVVSREEVKVLESFAPWARTTAIPNGVDLEYFVPPRIPAAGSTIVFTGAMDYFPNVDAAKYFVDAVFPRVRDRAPDAQFRIVGKNPTPAVRSLASRPGVTVTGGVPDVRPYLRDAALAVAPLRVARGIQNKVLEGMAMGLPVVATRPAHEGLEARAGRHLFVEDDPAAFADLVVRLLRDAALRAVTGREARAFVEARHSWKALMTRVDRTLSEITVPSRPTPLTAVRP